MNNTPQSRHRHARPKGCRSCALDRTGTLPKTPQQSASVIAYEASPFTDALAGLSTTELSAAFARFNDKVEQARLGKLRFGRGEWFDVDSMDCTEDVLELKWKDLPPRAKKRGLWLRLYFSEPDLDPGLLLQLNLECKTADRAAQDQAARKAQARLEAHYA